MNIDFHYYATFAAAIYAGYSYAEASEIAFFDAFCDKCTFTFLKEIKANIVAATTQSTIELADYGDNILDLQNITRIWSSFHFLPGDLYKEVKKGSKTYKNKYRLICFPNSDLLKKSIDQIDKNSLPAIGMVLHILSDTWAHQYFAGTPSLVINNVSSQVYEIINGGDKEILKKVTFHHNVIFKDNVEESSFINPLSSMNEISIMNLGHGRIGHLPDFGYIKYKYMPSYLNYQEIIKDNPNDYLHAFKQMVYALKHFKNHDKEFLLNKEDELDEDLINKIKVILSKKQVDASSDWAALVTYLSKQEPNKFDLNNYKNEYLSAKEKVNTSIGAFIIAAIRQKSLVTHEIYKSNNLLAGYSLERLKPNLKDIKDFLVYTFGKEK